MVLTWKKSAMVATWLAQAHFLASGTSSPTWEREDRKEGRGEKIKVRERKHHSRLLFPFRFMRTVSSWFGSHQGLFVLRRSWSVIETVASCDPVITTHSQPHNANTARSNYTEKETGTRLQLICIHSNYLSIRRSDHLIYQTEWRGRGRRQRRRRRKLRRRRRIKRKEKKKKKEEEKWY